MDSFYHPPTALTAISCTFLALGAICFLVTAADILWRKGWRSMMLIMIPVYPINAAYMGPLTLYIYFRYGRAAKPSSITTPGQDRLGNSTPSCHAGLEEKENEKRSSDLESGIGSDQEDLTHHACHAQRKEQHQQSEPAELCSAGTNPNTTPHCHSSSPSRPLLITILTGVSHCGAGCVLGDIVGEWLVYSTGITIRGQSIWPCLLIDYAFALLFGIIFQYFSIAPMSGDYSPKTLIRAAKADILSLTSFEVGAFAWMVIYQVGIWDYELGMDTWTYWWMMQVGMAMGFATAVPANYLLLKWGIKEACC